MLRWPARAGALNWKVDTSSSLIVSPGALMYGTPTLVRQDRKTSVWLIAEMTANTWLSSVKAEQAAGFLKPRTSGVAPQHCYALP